MTRLVGKFSGLIYAFVHVGDSLSYQVPIANSDIYKCSFPLRPLGIGMHFQTLLFLLLKVPRMELPSAVINLLLNYIYTLSGPPRKARAKPSNHHEKKYLAMARIEDIYKKRARVRKWW